MLRKFGAGLALLVVLVSTGASAGTRTCSRQVIFTIPETGGVYELVWCCTTTQFGTSCHAEYQYNWYLEEP